MLKKWCNNITIKNPALVEEWDYEKNGELNPKDFTVASHKKIWWKCRYGHSWQAAISNRTYGHQGCPYCSGRRVLRGINDLATVLPKIAAQWDYVNNDGLMPHQISSCSQKKVWWKCKYGHSWQSSVSNRKKGNGCPYCSGRIVLQGINDLATLYPELAAQWDCEKNGGLLPSCVTIRSNKTVWWLGACGHSWRTSIYNRTKGHGCPYCSGRYALSGVNDLGTVSPSLVSEWDYKKNTDVEPNELMAYSNRKVWWLCKHGHSWQATVSRRTQGCGCPYCAGGLVLQGVNDLETLCPELISEWDYEKNGELKPCDVKVKSSRAVWWSCKHSHSWKATVYSRSNGTGCPYCCNLAILPGYNDLESINPELAAEWDAGENLPLLPTNIGAKSSFKVWWRCKHGHRWQARVKDRNDGGGCPFCSGKQILPGFNDFVTRFPQLALQWDYEKNGTLSPNELAPFSSIKVWWRCDSSHSWLATIRNRVGGSNCPYCLGQAVLRGFNDLATLNPTLAEQWDYNKNEVLTPHMVTVSSGKAVWWICSLGHSWRAVIANRNAGTNCPFCSGKKLLKGFNDLCTTYPNIAAEWDYHKNINLHPEDFYYGSLKKVWWRCSEGHSWYSQIRLRKKCGCPYCAGNLVIQGVNDLLTLNPLLSLQWDVVRNGNLSPQDVTAMSGKKAWWICDSGHSWQAVVASRNSGNGCPHCANLNKSALVTYSGTQVLSHELLKEWDYEKNTSIKPENVTHSSHYLIWWKCKHGHSWQSAVSDRSSGKGCPFCVGKRTMRTRLI